MSALVLKLIACGCMLLDHIGFQWGILPLRYVGRMAFPIFLFLICNGYRHTSNPLRYALRLGIFALISQVPFSLFCYNRLWSSNWNVFFTLLMALLCIWAVDSLRKRCKWVCWLPAAVLFLLYHFQVLRSDYGGKAILMAMVFYWLEGKNWAITVGYIVALFYSPLVTLAKGLLLGGSVLDGFDSWTLIQGFSACALPLIFSYNGQKGGGSKLRRFAFYAFYPVHLLMLWLIRIV